jgi:hypothetical protein
MLTQSTGTMEIAASPGRRSRLTAPELEGFQGLSILMALFHNSKTIDSAGL